MSTPPPKKKPKRVTDGEQIDTSILDLPDDCLISIFKHLQLMDWVALHESCKRFHDATEYCYVMNGKYVNVIHHRHTFEYFISFHRDVADKNDNTNDEDSLYCFTDVNRIFRTFGQSIVSLNLTGFSGTTNTNVTPFLLSLNHSRRAILRRLHLKKVTVDASKIDDCCDLFKYLEELHIVRALSKAAIENCLVHCQNLIDLEMVLPHTECIDASVLIGTSSHLERFSYFVMENNLMATEMSEFLRQHPHLKSIKIPNVLLPSAQCINAMPNMEQIHIDLRLIDNDQLKEAKWHNLLQLKCLKRLDLLVEQFSDDIGMQQSIATSSPPISTVEVLVLRCLHLNDVLKILRTFNFVNLTKLIVSFWTLGCDSVGMIPDFPALLELQFIDFPSEVQDCILQFVRNARNLKHLVLLTYFQSDFNTTFISRLTQIQRLKETDVKLTVHMDFQTSAMVLGPDPNWDQQILTVNDDYNLFGHNRLDTADDDFFHQI